jgi:hypothetical protein
MLDRAPPSLLLYLAIGLLVRLPAVFCAHGFEFLDQQYQYVDPAWHLATGDDFLRTHEWRDGLRSWLYPAALAGVFRGLLALGVEEPLALMTGARAAHALLGLLPLAAFWLVVVRWRPVPRPWPALLFFAASGAVVFAGVQPSGPTVGAVLATVAVLLFLGPPRIATFLAGACAAFAFAVCYPDAIFGVVLAGACVAARDGRKLAWLVAGALGPFLLWGFLGQATWGRFGHSAFAYFHFNVTTGKSGRFGTEPWWYYLIVAVAPYAFLVPPCLRAGVACLRRGARVLAMPLLAAAVYVLVHSLIARKSFRFMLPAFGVLSAVLAVESEEVAAGEGALQTFTIWSF